MNLCMAMTCHCRAFELERRQARNKRYTYFEIAQKKIILTGRNDEVGTNRRVAKNDHIRDEGLG